MLPTTLPTELLDRIRQILPEDTPVYLVGGAVRDALLGKPVHDLDFVLPERAMPAGRKVANALGIDFFPMDTERDTARLIQAQPDGSRLFLDFAGLRALDLESDLRDRDFTINAMALDLRQLQTLIDPLQGAQDLRNKVIRPCSEASLLNDPVRALRGIRLATALGYQLLPETRQLIRQALPRLPQVSAERLRDEIFRILDGPQPATAMHILAILGGLPYTLPELSPLAGVSQSPPHTLDVWSHTLGVVQKLSAIFNILAPQHNPEAADNWTMGLISLRLGRYRQQLHEHLTTPLNPDRSLRALLLLAALYHDSAKPQTRRVEENGRIRFFEHDELGAKLVAERAARLHLSNDEIERLKLTVRHHMRPILLAQPGEDHPEGKMPTRRAIYRFFRSNGSAGVDICLLSLADTLATYGSALPQETWTYQLDVIRSLLESWWEKPAEHVSPPALLSGHHLMQTLALPGGPQIGQLLELIREAQAAGEISTQEEALQLARAWLEKQA